MAVVAVALLQLPPHHAPTRAPPAQVSYPVKAPPDLKAATSAVAGGGPRSSGRPRPPKTDGEGGDPLPTELRRLVQAIARRGLAAAARV
jgi:hypothetical protein